MAERVFTATHGVTLADTGPKGEYQEWARFERAPELEGPDGAKVYRFATSDPKVAERLLSDGCKPYGVTEVTGQETAG